MSLERCDLSLSGLSSLLIALGGWSNAGALRVCEKYNVDRNKWSNLPSLNTSRYSPGSILLQSMRAFCFCGCGSESILNSIERLEPHQEGGWKTLPLNDKIAKTYYLAATEYGNKVVLFGGSSGTFYITYILSEEGELEMNLSFALHVSGLMRTGPYSVKRGKIYALGENKAKIKTEWNLRVFDGQKWMVLK